jgi:hypothetical protein
LADDVLSDLEKLYIGLVFESLKLKLLLSSPKKLTETWPLALSDPATDVTMSARQRGTAPNASPTTRKANDIILAIGVLLCADCTARHRDDQCSRS